MWSVRLTSLFKGVFTEIAIVLLQFTIFSICFSKWEVAAMQDKPELLLGKIVSSFSKSTKRCY